MFGKIAPKFRGGTLNTGINTGVITGFAGKIALIPSTDYNCDGSAKNRNLDSALFAVIGTGYGAGNGLTTFTLPDKRSKFTIGGCTDLVAGNTSIPGTGIAGGNTNNGNGGGGTSCNSSFSTCGSSTGSALTSVNFSSSFPTYSAEYKLIRR